MRYFLTVASASPATATSSRPAIRPTPSNGRRLIVHLALEPGHGGLLEVRRSGRDDRSGGE